MKKFVQILGCLTLGALVLTSCVKNEESDGVKAIREATAKEINADAKAKEIQNLITELDLLKAKNEYDATKQLLIDIAIAEKSAELLEAQIALKEAQAGEGNTYILALKDEVDEIRGKISTINAELYGSSGTAGGYTVQIATINNTIAANKKAIEDLDTEDDAAQIAVLKAQNNALTAQKEEIEKLIASKKTEIAALQSRLDSLIAEIAAL